MSEHFAAFSFVDRITAYEPGKRARARFAVPAGIASFPSSLIAEAVGQLAAWVAMKAIDFRGRPVAALANDTRFHGVVQPGQALELSVEIESADDEAVAYAGAAHCDGALRIELIDCLGPMLPVAEFDAPEALSARFDLLLGQGAEPGRFHGVPEPHLVAGETIAGERSTATLHVPVSAPFFADHFPRRPVFPATLLLDAQIRQAMALARGTPRAAGGKTPIPTRMTHVKVRSFTAPGDILELVAEVVPGDDAVGKMKLSAHAHGKTVATARLEYTAA
jgi:3-hydroxymyristoyl/3-hydroxydecanoyl-(acyl carrier protein) dehydratase